MTLPDLSDRAEPGTQFAVRVTPRAARNALDAEGEVIRIRVTAVPENGKATEAAQKLLAKSLGVAPSRLRLIRGATARNKVFQLA